jgi:UDP-N-acetylglucosamine transferase subunit ALG13
MILVSVGTEKFPFDRLMGWIDLLLRHDLIGEEVVVQYGSCTVLPGGSRVYRVLRESEFHQLILDARIVIAHCGEGTVLLLDSLTTPYILVPRSQRFREHVDDHQVELARALERFGVPIGWGPADLVRFLAEPRRTSIGDLSVAASRAVCTSLARRFPATAAP